MMLNVPGTPRTNSAAAWLRRSSPSAESLRAFLQSGALFAWSEDRWIIAWGDPVKSAQPHPDHLSFYRPDFMLRDLQPYQHSAAIAPQRSDKCISGNVRDGTAASSH